VKLKEVFGNSRIVGLAGEKDSGKTNNIIALIKDFRQYKKDVRIYVYGLEEPILEWLKKNFREIYEVSSLEQLATKKNCLIVLDEISKLNLNNRRYTEQLNLFVDFVYHNNNWVILSSPSLREFNSIIGGKIERWAIKSINVTNLVNGSQLKEIVLNYKGRYKSINSIDVPRNELIIINSDYEKFIELEYIKEVDTKVKNINIFEIDGKR